MEKIESMSPKCQIHCLGQIAEPLRRIDRIGQLRFKAKRVLRRRLRYVHNRISRTGSAVSPASAPHARTAGQGLETGQLVRVKSRDEIQSTLDNWGYLRGCGFMEEMWPYCGTEQQVFKPVRSFLDERDYKVKKVRSTVILEGVHCKGTNDYGRCDRNCYFFWREEWLEKID
ncbi:MAG: hypothetical protein ACWGQW_06030 [bacterium]